MSDPTDVSVRNASPTDGEAIALLFVEARRVAMPWLPVVHTPEEIREWIDGVVVAKQRVWVAEQDSQVRGFAALDGAWLEHLYVAPNAQRQGLGARLLDVILANGPLTIRLHTFQKNTVARKFYESRGFVEVARSNGDNEERQPDITLEKRRITHS